MLSCPTTSRPFSNKVSAVSFKSLTKASNKPFASATCFSPGNFADHLHNPPQTLVFDIARNVPTKLKHDVICKSAVPFQALAVSVNFSSVSVCQQVNVVRSVFCHLLVPFFAKPWFTTVNLVHFATVYTAKSVNSAHHIRRVFPFVHCTTSIHRHFPHRGR